MKSIKKKVLKKAEERSRKFFPAPTKFKKPKGFINYVSSMITSLNKESFASIERDMFEFPMLQDIDFRVITENPNQKYHLVRGMYEDSEIEARLITDGEHLKTTLHSFGRNGILNPLNPSHQIRLTESCLDEIEIAKATFAIEQYLVRGRIEFVRFISEISDRDELRKIASYILYTKSNKNVNVLSLRK